MKKSHHCVAAVLIIALATTAVNSVERQMVDRIVAIVGEEVILASELGSQMQLIALQTDRRPRSEEEARKMQQEILDQMVSDRLFLVAARKDTTIKIRPAEIDRALDDQVQRIVANFGSHDEFLQALAAEGLSLRDLKRKYRTDVENQMLKQRYIQSRLYDVAVSHHEVEEFYYKFKDSIPVQPEAAKLAHIVIPFEPSQEVEDSIREVASGLRQTILDGADFATISAKHSSLGAGANGGDLGYVSREDVVPEFARAAFNLSVGDISGVIRTQFGFHVIKCEGIKGERYKLRHLLLAAEPTSSDSIRVRRLSDSLLSEIRNGADFAELAKAFSHDDNTRAQGGELGWFAVQQLPPEFASEVAGWKTVGE
ncbi:MAG: peptidylprolyl isomerase, partial [Candidatus Zixiibacteriota bacterium]